MTDYQVTDKYIPTRLRGTPKTLTQAIQNGMDAFEERKYDEPFLEQKHTIEVAVMDWIAQQFCIVSSEEIKRVWDRMCQKAPHYHRFPSSPGRL